MSITRLDERAKKRISEMGVGLGPKEGSDGGRTRGRMGGSDLVGRTAGVGLGGLDWGRTGAFHVQKKIKHFSFRNYIKILLNLVNFSPPLQSPGKM